MTRQINMRLRRVFMFVVAFALYLAMVIAFSLVQGCYIGRANFQGEDMRMYPFFGSTATNTSVAAGAE